MNKSTMLGLIAVLAASALVASALVTTEAFASTSSSFSVKQSIKQSISQSGFFNAAAQIAINNVGW